MLNVYIFLFFIFIFFTYTHVSKNSVIKKTSIKVIPYKMYNKQLLKGRGMMWKIMIER